MDFDTIQGRPIDRIVDDIHAAFKRPWWRFWKPQLTKAKIRRDINVALLGEPAPIRLYGIALGPARERAMALTEGLARPGDPMDQTTKAKARLMLIARDVATMYGREWPPTEGR